MNPQQLVDLVAEHGTIADAARAAGIPRKTFSENYEKARTAGVKPSPKVQQTIAFLRDALARAEKSALTHETVRSEIINLKAPSRARADRLGAAAARRGELAWRADALPVGSALGRGGGPAADQRRERVQPRDRAPPHGRGDRVGDAPAEDPRPADALPGHRAAARRRHDLRRHPRGARGVERDPDHPDGDRSVRQASQRHHLPRRRRSAGCSCRASPATTAATR
jgi:hypothetical protein